MESNGSGKFVVFEGVDCSGKSTQLQETANWLRNEVKRNIVCCKDPGVTDLGKKVRRIILHSKTPLDARSEMLLFMAARNQLVSEVIRPALQNGSIVLCDRFILSTMVYQGYASEESGLTESLIQSLWKSINGLFPTLTFIFDIPVHIIYERLENRNGSKDNIESRDGGFIQRVHEGFRTVGQQGRNRILLSGRSKISEIQTAVQREIIDHKII